MVSDSISLTPEGIRLRVHVPDKGFVYDRMIGLIEAASVYATAWWAYYAVIEAAGMPGRN